jgi:hypothetical protein
MRRGALLAAACGVFGSLALSACGGSGGSANRNVNVGVCGGQTGNASARTADYIVVLVAGPPEGMAMGGSPSAGSSGTPTPTSSATPSPSSSSSPGTSPSPSASASGTPGPEVVLSGALTDVSGAGATHVELHICKRTTGAVATALHPTITLRNISTGSPPVAMPVAVMEGAGEGVNDLHYGNNMQLEAGDAYAVTVRIGSGDIATLDYHAPQTGAPISPPPANCIVNHQLC